MIDRIENATDPVRIGIIGKYVDLPDAYLSVVESLKHAGFHHGACVEIELIQAEQVEGMLAEGRLRDLDGIVIPGGFGGRGIEGKIAAAEFAREQKLPCLGICLGMQVMTIEFARNVLGHDRGQLAASSDAQTPHPVIDLMDEPAREIVDHGGHDAPRRLRGPGSCRARQVARALRRGTVVSERHRHRYEFNPALPPAASTARPSCCSGSSPDDRLVEFIELPGHPMWVGTQAHPEFKSCPKPTRRRCSGSLIGAALCPRRGSQPEASSSSCAPEPAPPAPGSERGRRRLFPSRF